MSEQVKEGLFSMCFIKMPSNFFLVDYFETVKLIDWNILEDASESME